MPLYKSILFNCINFESKCIDKQINIIIKGLNIKNRKQRIMFIYDEACRLIDNKSNGKNICGFKNCRCICHRKQNLNYYYGCCRMCRYKTDNGCPTKNLACKLFNCSFINNKHDVIEYNQLKVLKLLSIRQRFLVKSDYFALREDVLKDLYSYSFIYSSIKIIFRLVINVVYIKRNEKFFNDGGNICK